METKREAKRLLSMATLAGKIMLESGAETYRVEDTISRICESRSYITYSGPFVTPTGILLSIGFGDDILTYIQRTKSRTIDLNKIALVNEFSRNFVSSEMTIDEGFKYLEKIDSKKAYHSLTNILFGGFGAGFFSLLFGGTINDFICTFLISMLVIKTNSMLGKINMIYFINNFVAAAIGTFLAIISVKLGLGSNMDKIIIGIIMPLVPGVAITNAARDSMLGDFLAGMSRGFEAVIVALSVAFGVGLMLIIFHGGM
ncbi:threonine/serine exporter family protein [Proteiniborus sp. MB09-C3]|uniref:threonine/serine ThrE exporter family protein n=1 Tax=Proteiniborus sp. MB09-C3 TaxID=3050072 RepID=UPI002553ADCE|nr:threonine/serine exporter family protein [Proteiniborus sp. MB09-C3]WIV10774.1 threonine/serine exporter family protein [Proteiniborus sp. MB09-C3]